MLIWYVQVRQEEQRLLTGRVHVPGSNKAPPARAVAGAHRPRLGQQGPLPRHLRHAGGGGGGVRRRGHQVPRPQRRHQLRPHALRRRQDHGQQHAAAARPRAPQEGRRPRLRRHGRGCCPGAAGCCCCCRRGAAATAEGRKPAPAPPRRALRRGLLLRAARPGGHRRGRRPPPQQRGATRSRVQRGVVAAHQHRQRQLPRGQPRPRPVHALLQAAACARRQRQAGQPARLLGVHGRVGQGRRLHRAHARVRRLDRRLTGRISRSIHTIESHVHLSRPVVGLLQISVS
uniref:Uncharacterized protein n=1 Tax=Zea mays TaxID=4577 RepID=C4J8Z2_MAIZE|nr:unknown [Zea mays]|eukprot:NP_001183581.1 uncharacterized protein LOC100502174 [Zea mays]